MRRFMHGVGCRIWIPTNAPITSWLEIGLLFLTLIHGMYPDNRNLDNHRIVKIIVEFIVAVLSMIGGWSRCTRYYTSYYSVAVCCPRHFSDYPTCTPICNPRCQNGGTCTKPDTCRCQPGFSGATCGTVLCSHLKPCLTGTCDYPSTCHCFDGFSGDRCQNFDSNNNLPEITSCSINLKFIEREDNKEKFNHNLPCSQNTNGVATWSNQEKFNYAEFTMNTHYPPKYPDEHFPRLNYVSNFGFGIVSANMQLLHTKIPRDGGSVRYQAFRQTYPCSGISSLKPERNQLVFTKHEKNYDTGIEHGDEFSVTYTATSGGFARLIRTGTTLYYRTLYYAGQTTTQNVVMKFDFFAPVHCSEDDAPVHCTDGQPLHTNEDITRNPVTVTWPGWSDSLSGLLYYKLEAFLLAPTIHNELTEKDPLSPMYSFKIENTLQTMFNLSFVETAMYSVLLTTVDKANNTKVTRRLVLFDNSSAITVTKPGLRFGMLIQNDVIDMRRGDGGMHVISAIPETGYMWQTSENANATKVVLNFENHFVNRIHEDGMLLNEVIDYPIQFQQLQADGILRSEKFVALDDDEGARTKASIPNIHGIVKFEVKHVYNDDRQVPTAGWAELPLTEQYEFEEPIADGSFIRLWVRATDIVNNTYADYTEVHVDNTPPIVNDERIQLNIINGSYTYTSRITCKAADVGSGVHKIGYALYVGNDTKVKLSGTSAANINNASDACSTDTDCRCVLGTCFKVPQKVDIDNCWFVVPKEDLDKAGTIVVTVYNQALLTREFNFSVDALSDLHGLEEYSGPSNIRVAEKLENGIRLTWDIPKTASCYGRVDIFVVVFFSDGTSRVVKVSSEQSSVDILGLEADSHYTAALNAGYKGTNLASIPFAFQTAPKSNHLDPKIIAGIAVGVAVAFAVMIAIFVVLLRRGHMQPVQRGLTAVRRQARQSMAGIRGRNNYNNNMSVHNKVYRESVYIDGDMDYTDAESWKMSRDDIVLESLLKSGSFAEIYLANIRSRNTQVAAKTLKKGFTDQDKYVMKAKINFYSTEVGHHENVLDFVGAVVEEEEITSGESMGPMILLDYCVNGQLNDYLTTMRGNVTLESHELLFRFGIHVARGMEYLAGKDIVHTRLAARNVLLTESLDCKITGICPRREDCDKAGDGDVKKREKIPMKWVAPECMKSSRNANEKSDVWSYGVVVWEIFSIGEVPYADVRGRDLPDRLKKGHRLSKPESCDDNWYEVMTNCWQYEAAKRPTFGEILGKLDEIFVPTGEDDYYLYRR